MTTTPDPDELPDETPGGSTIVDPEVFNDPAHVDDDDDPPKPPEFDPPAG